MKNEKFAGNGHSGFDSTSAAENRELDPRAENKLLKEEIASLESALSINKSNSLILIEMCESGKLPEKGRDSGRFLTKAGQIGRDLAKKTRARGIFRLSGKFVEAWRSGGLKFALQKGARKLVPGKMPKFFRQKENRLAAASFYEPEEIVASNDKVRLVAFYLPQFHNFPENDAWWGTGFTEWTNVRRAKPLFTNHLQPRRPLDDPGYYDLANPDTMRRQADLAKRHGIYGFCFHHYYFSGKRLMEKPVDNLLAHPEIEINFCLNWANENWTRRWDGQEKNVLIAQQHSPEDDLRFWRDVSRYFRDPRHIRIEGRPLFMVYHAALFPDMRETLWRWRKWCVENGEPIPYLVMVQSFFNQDPRDYGFDAAVQFPPHIGGFIPPAFERDYEVEGLARDFKGEIFDYDKMAKFWLNNLSDAYVDFPCVFPAWDNTPRRGATARLFFGSSPARYEKWLACALDEARKKLPCDRQFVFINAWNEWGEGAYLEPDKEYGFAYLNATSRALEKKGRICPALPLDPAHSLKVLFVVSQNGDVADLLADIWRHSSVAGHVLLAGGNKLAEAIGFPTLACDPANAGLAQIEKFCEGPPDLLFWLGLPDPALSETITAWKIPEMIWPCKDDLADSRLSGLMGQNTGSLVCASQDERQILEKQGLEATVCELGELGTSGQIKDRNNAPCTADDLSGLARLLGMMRKLAGKEAPLSIVVPNYNYDRYLEARLVSIVRQTYADYELVLLDDASTDDSLAILKKWRDKTGARLEVNGQNSGNVYAQWQKGLELARGQYVWLAEADDLSADTYLAKMLGTIGPETNLAYAIPEIIDESGKLAAMDYRRNYLAFAGENLWEKSRDADGREEIATALAIVCAAPNISATVFRKKPALAAICEAREFTCSGDWIFYICLALAGRVSYCHEALAFHRRHTQSVIGQEQAARGRVLDNEIALAHDFVRNKLELSAETLAKMRDFEDHVNNGQCRARGSR